MSPLASPAIPLFVTAGNATFTLVSAKTGTRFTFKVRVAKDNQSMHFVSVLTGPDNQNDYKYLGYVRRGVYFHGGAKAKIGQDAPSAKAFAWFWQAAVAKRCETPSLQVFHEGACGRCGRPLTVPQSIETGFGPECAGKMGGL